MNKNLVKMKAEECLVHIPLENASLKLVKSNDKCITAQKSKTLIPDDDGHDIDYKVQKIPHLSIKNWLEEERPREKLSNLGADAMTDSDLIAILISVGSRDKSAIDLAREVLGLVNGNLALLCNISIRQLMTIKGIGKAKAIGIIAAIELAKRISYHSISHEKSIKTSDDFYVLLSPLLQGLSYEEFWVFGLNPAKKIVFKKKLAKGAQQFVLINLQDLLKSLLDFNCTSFLIAHNHPMGTLKPSDADLKLTKQIRLSSQTLNITLLDHLIFTDHGYFSFQQHGLLDS